MLRLEPSAWAAASSLSTTSAARPRTGNVVAMAVTDEVRAVVLVEGFSDLTALEMLASRRGCDLRSEGVRVLAMDGATNVGHFLERFGPHGRDLRLAGLYDLAEEPVILRGAARAGLGQPRTRADLTRLGFFRCEADLEEELIRALGAASVLQVIADRGELASFRILQQQPAQRTRALEQQLQRFMGSRSGRKAWYARALVQALDLDRVPEPLDAALAFALPPPERGP